MDGYRTEYKWKSQGQERSVSILGRDIMQNENSLHTNASNSAKCQIQNLILKTFFLAVP